jgi:ubiquinone biosynthesis protein UbiJ
MDLGKMTREFLQNLDEGNTRVDIHGYIQALSETLSSISPRSQTEQRRMAVAKQHLKEIKKHTRKLQEKVAILEERVTLLEENNH